MTFLAWVVFGLAAAALAAPKDLGTGLVYFGCYWAVALIGGVIHATIVRRRSTPNKAQNK